MRKHTNGLHSCLQTPARQTAAATIRRAHEMAIWRDMGERSTAVQSAEFLSQIFRHFTHITRCLSVHVTMAARLLSSKEPATAILLSSHTAQTLTGNLPAGPAAAAKSACAVSSVLRNTAFRSAMATVAGGTISSQWPSPSRTAEGCVTARSEARTHFFAARFGADVWLVGRALLLVLMFIFCGFPWAACEE